MAELTDEQKSVLRKVLDSRELQDLIGAGDWDLTENEEMVLWGIINDWRLGDARPGG